MNALEKDLLSYLAALPEEAKQQLLDFARFLKKKNSGQKSASEHQYSQSNAEIDHLEEEFAEYQLKFPRE